MSMVLNFEAGADIIENVHDGCLFSLISGNTLLYLVKALLDTFAKEFYTIEFWMHCNV